MRGLPCIAVLASACASHSGAYLDVKVADPTVTTVALYLGNAPCALPRNGTSAPCPALTPEAESFSLAVGSAGGAWLRDDAAPYEAPVVGGRARFHLEAIDSEIGRAHV